MCEQISLAQITFDPSENPELGDGYVKSELESVSLKVLTVPKGSGPNLGLPCN